MHSEVLAQTDTLQIFFNIIYHVGKNQVWFAMHNTQDKIFKERFFKTPNAAYKLYFRCTVRLVTLTSQFSPGPYIF